jgi:hypothetical protein
MVKFGIVAAIGLTLLPQRGLLDEQAVLRRQRLGSQREHAANFVRHRKNPLPHRDVGQDAIHEVLGMALQGSGWDR